jgi:hypothetical protein
MEILLTKINENNWLQSPPLPVYNSLQFALYNKINASLYHINFIIKKKTPGMAFAFVFVCIHTNACVMHYAIYIRQHAWVISSEIFETL